MKLSWVRRFPSHSFEKHLFMGEQKYPRVTGIDCLSIWQNFLSSLQSRRTFMPNNFCEDSYCSHSALSRITARIFRGEHLFDSSHMLGHIDLVVCQSLSQRGQVPLIQYWFFKGLPVTYVEQKSASAACVHPVNRDSTTY